VKIACERDNGTGYLASNNTTAYVPENGCDDGSDPNLTTGECVPTPECPFVDGEQFQKSGIGTAPASICQNGCNFVPGGASIAMDGGYMGWYEVAGSCSGGDDPGINTGLNCIQTSNGTQYCSDPNTTQNCGTINGEYTCLDAVPPGNCILTPMGQAICDGGSQVNSPDDSIDLDTGETVDVYGDGNTGGTSGGNGSTQGTNDTDGDGQPDGQGDGSGDDTCPPWQDCDETHSGAVPAIPDDGCPDFECINQNFYTTVSNGPLMSTVSAMSWSSGSSTCPAPSFDLFGTTIPFNMHCTIGNDVRTALSVVFFGIWLLVATRIFLSA
jgi:hypothetical protein